METEASSSTGSVTSVNDEIESKIAPVAPYEVNSMILCSHTDNLFYEAKIIAVKVQTNGEYMYTVHYQGWSKRYDENIPHSRTPSRFRPFTPENIELAKMEMKEAKAALSPRKKKPPRTELRRGCSSTHLSDSSSNTSRPDKFSVRQSKKQETEDEVSVPDKLKALLENDRNLVESKSKLPRLHGRSTVSQVMQEKKEEIGRNRNQDEFTFPYFLPTTINPFEYVIYVRKLDTVCAEVRIHKGRARYWRSVVAALDECVDNLKSFFDLVLMSDVLYPNEKLRHKDLTEGDCEIVELDSLSNFLNEPRGLYASEYYGFIYLLRLLVKFPQIIEYMPCDKDSKNILSAFVQSFIRYLGNNSEKFFDPELDYEPISEDYKQRLLQQNYSISKSSDDV
ncbi:unnamed protein product [Thelazia callipaeda]|uniref:MRG domain-containing protein n=1 Tax=Thelazia callipaeda TaxID=103827 RepID=A0A158RCK5_THECL|nr:unnamed protein product [Thelazia callipaeda]